MDSLFLYIVEKVLISQKARTNLKTNFTKSSKRSKG